MKGCFRALFVGVLLIIFFFWVLTQMVVTITPVVGS